MASDAPSPPAQAPSPSGTSPDEGGQKKTLSQRMMRFLRSSAVGIAATLADFGVLELCVRVLDMDPPTAKIISSVVGIAVQFIGNRTFAFHASQGKLGRQIALFCVVESGTLTLNWLLFRFLTRSLHLPIEVTNIIVTAVVYVGFSYPAWRLVFRVRKEDRAPGTGEGRSPGAT